MRVTEPGAIRAALAWARRRRTSAACRLVEILTEHKENAAMGQSVAAINEVYP